jgi:hypothetical protein
MASSFSFARNRIMTRMRIMSPIIETPSRMPEANDTIAMMAPTVGTTHPLFF